jgi:hypothetical protein
MLYPFDVSKVVSGEGGTKERIKYCLGKENLKLFIFLLLQLNEKMRFKFKYNLKRIFPLGHAFSQPKYSKSPKIFMLT